MHSSVPSVVRRPPAATARPTDAVRAAVRGAPPWVAPVLVSLPLLLILVTAAPRLAAAPVLLGGYGCLVLSTSVALLLIAYCRYEDPAVCPPRRPPGDAANPFPPLPPAPRVSFLLAVKDERDGIEACVRSMAASDYPHLQIIVVDDASTDGTRGVLRRLAAELPIQVLYLDRNVGKKHALVRAAEHADGDVLAFTDSDCVLARDALSRCVTALVRHPELGAVSGHARALNADASVLSRTQDVWYEGQFRITKAAEYVLGSVTCLSGPLAVFRRDAVYNYLPAWAQDRFLGGEFRFATDRQLTGYVLGQFRVGDRLKRRHADSPFVAATDYPARPWRTGYVESAKVWTTVPARLRPFLRQQVRWKKSFIRNLFFTGGFMWRRGLGAAALFYGHVLLVLAAPLMAARHLLWAPANGLWLLTALYLSGIALKGIVWGLAFRIDNPGSPRWRYRPLMSLLSAALLAWLLPYALVTIRRGVWSRSAA
ncbi:glycosyltransferase family 2 protein [Allostreptomyces psammosilenae]|uniref:Hyaluronan synthase n=1 Tax=Allostreptomyces psammosilenae TaxID=1892865 RepID=A0A852ZQR6_9ACTN|nr:glycosyltransferase [Allostreptomyces psammosilenae]NYI04743.1 cellulose synthase/poly-beta-1,6-N-acetylglucosamine synthase-like glycosyltransferase [Allostreptomyces psammosilenae]